MEGNNPAKLFGYTPGNLGVKPRHAVAGAIALDQNSEYAMGCMLPDDMAAQPLYYHTPEMLLSAFVTHRYRTHELLLHNADRAMVHFLPTLEGMVARGDYEAQFTVNTQGHIMHVRIANKHNVWYIRDTFGLMPQPLEELCKLANYTGEYTPIPEDPFAFDVDLSAMLYRDARILLQAYKAFGSTMAKTFGVRPALTTGGTAMRAFLTTLTPGHVHYRNRPQVEAFSREGYFGALNFITELTERRNVAYIDVNAMYATAMRSGVPVMGAIQTPYEEPGYPGVYECVVVCPDRLPIPIVPERAEVQGFKVTRYPYSGTFRSVLFSPTIDAARDLGYTVDVGSGYFWERTDDVFGAFVSRCEELEAQYRERGARVVIKNLRNALYGKFGQKEKGKEYFLTLEPTEDMTPQINGFDGEEIENFYYRNITISRPYMMPHWAGWITATARNILARAAYALGDSVYYGDNDSLMLDAARLDGLAGAGITMGQRYGEWKLVRHYDTLSLAGKKRYVGVTGDGEIREHDIKWAGIPRNTITPRMVDQARQEPTPIPYTLNNRAVDTTGGRTRSREVSQTITLPRTFYHEDIPAYSIFHEDDVL